MRFLEQSRTQVSGLMGGKTQMTEVHMVLTLNLID